MEKLEGEAENSWGISAVRTWRERSKIGGQGTKQGRCDGFIKLNYQIYSQQLELKKTIQKKVKLSQKVLKINSFFLVKIQKELLRIWAFW